MDSLPLVAKQRIEAAVKAPSDGWHRLNLARLDLTDEDLSKIDWASMAHSVSVMDLSGNAQLTRLPQSMCVLDNLQELLVYKCNLVLIPPRMFTSLKKLHTLMLSDNCLTSLPLDLGKLDNLRVIDLSCNRFSVPPSQLGACKALVTLTMTNNPRLSADHQTMLKEGTLISYLQENPCVPSSLSLAGLLQESKSSDWQVDIHTAEGIQTMNLHRCVVFREALFRNETKLGSGEFTGATWNNVIQFLYSGSLCVPRAELQILAAFLQSHNVESLAPLVNSEMALLAQVDAEHVAAVEKAKAENAVAPPAPVARPIFLDGTEALFAHTSRLLHDESLSDFEIVCAHGQVRRVHLPILEVRLSTFMGSMLRTNQWKECVERRISLEEDVEVVDSVLEWCHTDSLGFDRECDLLRVLSMAQMYQINDLASDCQVMIGDGLDCENAPSLFAFATETFGLDYLRARTMTWLKSHWYELVESQEWKALPASLKAVVVGSK